MPPKLRSDFRRVKYRRWRGLGIFGVSAALIGLLAASCARSYSTYLYDAGATRTCLEKRPERVHRFNSRHGLQMIIRRSISPLHVTFHPSNAFEGDVADVYFLPTELAARHFDASVRERLLGSDVQRFHVPHALRLHQRRRNVVVLWSNYDAAWGSSDSSARFRGIVLGCLETRRS
jgi:hypothetical protein